MNVCCCLSRICRNVHYSAMNPNWGKDEVDVGTTVTAFSWNNSTCWTVPGGRRLTSRTGGEVSNPAVTCCEVLSPVSHEKFCLSISIFPNIFKPNACSITEKPYCTTESSKPNATLLQAFWFYNLLNYY